MSTNVTNGWTSIRERFLELGGIVENLEPRYGRMGRGMFPIDAEKRSKIFCPSSLLVPKEDLILTEGIASISSKSSLCNRSKNFAADYYNDFSYGETSREEVRTFLDELYHLPDQAKATLASERIAPNSLLLSAPDEASAFHRFVSGRTVSYMGKRVLVPIWELINHSPFAPSFSTNRNGITTPTATPSAKEFFQKYNLAKSPLWQWAIYGFASFAIATYAFPFQAKLNSGHLILNCMGIQGDNKDHDPRSNITKCGDTLSIRSMPIGSISKDLPLSFLKSALREYGGNQKQIHRLLLKVQMDNILRRERLASYLENSSGYCAASLIEAVKLEVKLIQNSINSKAGQSKDF